jgi:hypothetical protein
MMALLYAFFPIDDVNLSLVVQRADVWMKNFTGRSKQITLQLQDCH